MSLRSIYVHFDDVESLLVAAAVRHGEYLISLARPSLPRARPSRGGPGGQPAHALRGRERRPSGCDGEEPFSPALQRALEAGRKARAEIDHVFAAEIAATGMHGCGRP